MHSKHEELKTIIVNLEETSTLLLEQGFTGQSIRLDHIVATLNEYLKTTMR